MDGSCERKEKTKVKKRRYKGRKSTPVRKHLERKKKKHLKSRGEKKTREEEDKNLESQWTRGTEGSKDAKSISSYPGLKI